MPTGLKHGLKPARKHPQAKHGFRTFPIAESIDPAESAAHIKVSAILLRKPRPPECSDVLVRPQNLA